MASKKLRLRGPSIARVVHLTTSVCAFILLAGTVVSQAPGDDGSHLRKQSRQTEEKIIEQRVRHLQYDEHLSPEQWEFFYRSLIIFIIFRALLDWSNVKEYRRLKREEREGRLDEASRDRLLYFRGSPEEGEPLGLSCCVFWGDVFRGDVFRETPPSRPGYVFRENPPSRRAAFDDNGMANDAAYAQMMRTNYGSLRGDTMTPVQVAGVRSSLESSLGRRGRAGEGARTERDSLNFDGGVEASPCSFEEATCCICMDAPPVYAFVPCGHLCLCETCQKAYDQTKCPRCEVGYSLIMKLY